MHRTKPPELSKLVRGRYEITFSVDTFKEAKDLITLLQSKTHGAVFFLKVSDEWGAYLSVE